MLGGYSSSEEEPAAPPEAAPEEEEEAEASEDEDEDEEDKENSEDESASSGRAKAIKGLPSADSAFTAVLGDKNVVFNKRFVEESKVRELQKAARDPKATAAAAAAAEALRRGTGRAANAPAELTPLERLAGGGRATARFLRLDAEWDAKAEDAEKNAKKPKVIMAHSADAEEVDDKNIDDLKMKTLASLGLLPGTEIKKEKGKKKPKDDDMPEGFADDGEDGGGKAEKPKKRKKTSD